MHKKNTQKPIASLIISIAILAGVFGARHAFAQAAKQIEVSAYVLDNQDQQIPNQNYDVKFALYTQATGGAPIWSETQTIQIQNGAMDAYLGAKTPLPTLDFSAQDYYLGITIGTDSEMTPRKQIASVPSAYNSLNSSNSVAVDGAQVGTNQGDILQLGSGGKVSIKSLPTGTGSNQLVLGNDSRLSQISNMLPLSGGNMSGKIKFVGGQTFGGATSSQVGMLSGISNPNAGDMLYFSSNGTLSVLPKGSDDTILQMSNGVPTWVLGGTGGMEATTLLDGLWHSDTTAATVVQGGLITGQGSMPTWSELAPGTSGQFLKSNGAGANLSWSGIGVSDISGLGALATVSSVNLSSQVNGTLAIANGGTGQTTAQNAINALTNVAAATDEYVLTKDTATGNAMWKVVPSGFANPMTTVGQILYQDISNTAVGLNVGTNGQILTSNGTIPTWSTSLSVGQGGTGATSFTSRGILYGNGASAMQVTGASGSANQVLMENASGAPYWGTVSGAGGLTGSGTINYVAVWSGSGSLGAQQYLAVANGGTGAGNASGARTNLGLGSLATASSVDLSSQVVNTLAAGNGGTGITTYSTGDILYASATNTLSRLTAGAQNSVLMINSSGVPYWGTVSGAGAVSASGSPTNGDLAVWSGSSSIGKLSPGASGTVLTSNGATMSWSPLDLSNYAYIDSNGANSDITSLTGITTALPVSEGGTGLQSLSDGSLLYYLSSGGDSLASLSRSTSADQVLMEDASGAPYWGTVSGAGGLTGSGTNNYVAVWSGSGSLGAQQYLAVANGGTGSGTAGGALTNLGAQAANVNLTAVSGGTWAGDTHIATVGTISSGTWDGSVIGATYGGTGLSTYSTGDILYASAANTLSKLSNTGADGKVLMISPTTHLPIWTSVSGAGSVTGSGTQNDVALWGSGGTTLVDGTVGNGLAVGSNTLGVSILGSGDAVNHTYSTSGLQFGGANNQLTLLQGCTNGQILKWDSVTNGGQWYCSDNLASSTAVINVNGQTNISEIDFDNNFQVDLSGSTDNIHLAPAGVTLGDASDTGKLSFTSADYGHTTTFAAGSQTGNITYTLPTSLSGSGTKYLAIDAGSGAMTWTSAGGTGGPGTVTDVAAGSGLATSLTGGADITNSGTLNINLFTSTYTDPGVPSSSSGLQFDPTTKALTLLQGCGNGQVLAYNNQSDYWYCSDFVAHAVAVISVNDTDNIQQIDFNTLNNTPSSPDFTFNVNSGAAAIGIDYANSGITRSNQNQTITSPWTFSNSSGITLGATGSTNTPGALSLVSAGNNTSNNYTTTFTAGQQNGSINYTLPTTGGGANKFLTANASGVMSWTTIAGGTGGLGTITSVSAGAGLSSVDDNSGPGSITSSGTVGISLLTTATNTNMTTSSVSGMEFEGANNQLTLLQGCPANDVLAWNGSAWACASVTGGSGLGGVSGTGSNGQIAIWSGGALTGTSTLGVTNGGTGTATAFTQGSVVFAGASGVYSQDNANFFWNGTNHRLGLGNTNPLALLSVGSSSQFQVDASGDISTSGKITSTNADLATGGAVYVSNGELKSQSSLPVSYGGTGATTLTGMLEGNGGVSAFSAITGTTGYVTYWSNNNAIGSEQFVTPLQGGTGLDGSAAGNGKILIGNGSGYTLATITQGTGIGITNGSGSITIANSGITGITGTAHEISVSGTGSVTLSTPQQIDTTSSPTFGGLTLNGNLSLGSNTISITNTSLVSNLNADMLDGYHASSFLQEETDPVFTASPAAGITNSYITNWNSAYSNEITSASGTAPLTLTLGTNSITGSISNATTAAKGVASFNSTNFTVTSGAVNTIQNIATSSSPSFNGLTLGGLTTAGIVTNTATGLLGTTATLGTSNGGTGANLSSGAAGGIVYMGASSAMAVNSAGSTGQVLLSGGAGAPTWGSPSSAGAVPISGLTPATGTNTIDNTNWAQTWNWSTLNTQTALAMNLNALTSGTGLSIASSNGSNITSASGLLYVGNTGSSGTGTIARFQSNSTVGSGLTILANGNVGIGTTTPGASFTVGANAFEVSSGGAIGAATGITSSGNIIFSGLNAAGIVTNTSGGTLGTETAITAAQGGTGISTSSSSGVPYISGGSWNVSSTTGTQLGYLSSTSGTTGTTSANLVFSTSPTLTTPTIATISNGANDFALSQNSINAFNSVASGAIANTLNLKAGNVGIGTTTFGTSAAGILALGNGTAPTTSITGAQIWSTASGLNIMGSGSTGTVTLGNNSVFNAAAGTTGNLLNLELGGTSKFNVDYQGNLTVAGANTTIDGVPYTWPSAQASSSGLALLNNGSGGLSWGTVVPSAAGAIGGIQFNSTGGTTNTMGADASKFFWDDTNYKLGIGTNSLSGSSAALQILATANSSAAVQLSYDANDNATLSSSPAGELLINTKYNNGGPTSPLDSSVVIGNGSTNANNTAYAEFAGNSSNYYAGYDYNTNTMRMGPQIGTAGSSTLSNVTGLTISSVGNVGIGTATPGYALEVNSTTNNVAYFHDGATNTGCTIGVGGVISCSSDINLKKNVTDLGYGLSTLMTLDPVQYNWKTDPDGTPQTLGFIAQDVQQVIPQLVSTDASGYEELNTIGLIPVLTKSIQDEEGQITSLQSLTTQQGSQIAAATAQETSDIANLTLQTDQNITTLQGLQTSVNSQLAIAGTALTNDENNISALQTSDTALNSFETQQTALNAQLQAQITQLQQLTDSSNIQVALAQVDLNTQDISYIKTLLGVDPNNPTDVTLVGKFTAQVVNGGELQITVADEAHRTIGVATISAASDNNGGDGKSVEVKNANINSTSKIFTSFENNPGSYSWVEKDKDSNGNYTGFTINLMDPVTNDTKVDWWIVQENGSDDVTADSSTDSSSSSSSSSSTSANSTTSATDATTSAATDSAATSSTDTTTSTTTTATDTTTTTPAATSTTAPATTDTTTTSTTTAPTTTPPTTTDTTTGTASQSGTSMSTGV